MIVLCKKNKCQYPTLVLPDCMTATIDENNFVASSEWYTIDSQVSGYCLKEGMTYRVYGILFFKGQMRFLIQDDNNMPGFFPSVLFTIKCADLLTGWTVKKYTMIDEELMVIADPMLIDSFEDVKAIVACRPIAINSLIEYKEFIEKYL